MRIVDPIERLQRLTVQHRTQAKAAAFLGITPAYFSDMINGRRNITDSILAKLGLKRVVVK